MSKDDGKQKVYDLDALKRGRATIVENITQFETALVRERQLLAKYDSEINAAELIVRKHNVVCPNEAHDWEVTATFPDGRWKKRRCKRCPTSQRLGPK